MARHWCPEMVTATCRCSSRNVFYRKIRTDVPDGRDIMDWMRYEIRTGKRSGSGQRPDLFFCVYG